MRNLTAERLRQVMTYDPETGVFFRKAVRTKKGTDYCLKSPRLAGALAPRHRASGLCYWAISVDGNIFLAHRLAWLYVYGEWPPHEVDHINGDGSDNRIVNLRSATRAQNSTNAPAQRSNKVGLRGVHYHPGAKRYRAQICKNLKTRHLGYFDTPEEAHAAYLKEAKEVHGEFVRAAR